MKFAREWKHKYYILDQSFRKYCLNYKSWKKKCKVYNIEILKKDLEKEVKRINISLRRIITRIEILRSIPYLFRCYTANYPLDIYKETIELNKKCLYKICKRIDKRKASNIMLSWYRSSAIKENNYIYTWLLLQQNTRKEPCPICFEETYNKTVIMECGHYLCHNCILNMIGSSQVKGTIHNIIYNYLYYHGNKIQCPLCRHKTPFNNFMILS